MIAMPDADTCIYLMNARPEVIVKEPLHECRISSIVMGELEFGCWKSQNKAANRAKLELLPGNLRVVEIGEAEAKACAELRFQLEKQTIGPNDMWIAAHALTLDLPLITNNSHEYSRVPSLVIDNWLKH